ncbi:hypothetical protein ACLB2K_014307 [Fragaria x ananassa]
MKFCKKYEEYMQGQDKKLPEVGFKKLKKILKKCRKDFHSEDDINNLAVHDPRTCPDHCPVCDGSFFPSLLNEMSDVVGFFNQKAQKLLEYHLASGFRKYMLLFKGKPQGNHVALIEEGKDLVTYALINAIAIRKILKKYDKIHYSKQGQAFNRERDRRCGCSLTMNDEKPTLTCELFDSVKVDIDLTCSICLDTVFDPVALTCGHIFCYMCACSAASVTIVDGLNAAESKEKCPLCREAKVYQGAVHLEELSILISRSCREYWEQRIQTEKVERVQQAKQHWESQCRLFMGV